VKAAVAYQKGDALFLHASSQTTSGLWIASPPFIKAGMNDTPSFLGSALLEALGGSLTGLPHPTHWNAVIKPLLDLATVTTWQSFARKAKSADIMIDEHEREIRIIPSRNLGTADGFEAITDESICLPNPSSNEALGTMLIEVLGKSR
jgi:hypothetical protein